MTKMLADLGVYERDIEKIAAVLGKECSDTTQLVESLRMNDNRLPGLSYMSQYVIEGLIA